MKQVKRRNETVYVSFGASKRPLFLFSLRAREQYAITRLRELNETLGRSSDLEIWKPASRKKGRVVWPEISAVVVTHDPSRQ